jgi:uncharacterized protein
VSSASQFAKHDGDYVHLLDSKRSSTYNEPDSYLKSSSMQVNVAQLLKEQVGAKRSYKVDELAGESAEYHVEGEVTFTRTNLGILVTGKLTTDTEGSCDRCLGPACAHTTLSIEDEYFPITDINTGEHIDVEPEALTISQDHILDLGEAIRQYIIIATTTKLLCDPECPGICSVCGQEFAKGDCIHRTKAKDHRWDKLAQLEKENRT